MLFSQWGVLSHATQYAQLARGFGFLVMLVATMWGLFDVLSTRAVAPMVRRYNHARRR
jgi:hypothetical protein